MARPKDLPKSGSEKLLSELGRPTQFAAKDLKAFAQLREAKGVRVVDWQQFGQPVPDQLRASLVVDKAMAPRVLGKLLTLDSLRINLDVFPEGIPVIEHIRINAVAGRR